MAPMSGPVGVSYSPLGGLSLLGTANRAGKGSRFWAMPGEKFCETQDLQRVAGMRAAAREDSGFQSEPAAQGFGGLDVECIAV